jgi:hypothetical protein
MYMQPITAAKQTRRKPRAAALKLTAGMVSLPFVAVALVSYWAVAALWIVIGGGAQLLRGSYDCLVFIGGELVGH